MPSFAMIAEGVTDQRVIANIIIGYFGDDDEEPPVNPVQPPSGAPAPGGWSLVLRSLEEGEHRKALQVNDYLVVHIDTDVSEEFGVSHREGGRELSVEELATRVIEKLKRVMGAEFCAKYEHQLIFAIAVHSTECWLLPLFHADSHARKVTGCLNAVNKARMKRNESPLSTSEHKYPDRYRDASREYTKRKRLMALHDKNPSLALFVRQLDKIVTAAVPDASYPSGDAPATASTVSEE